MYTKPLLITIVAIVASAETSKFSERVYLAGVVEFRPSDKLHLENRMLDNLEGYLTILDSEEAKNLDIIVFPESTLNSNEQAIFVSNPAKDLIVPCDLESTDHYGLLKQLSCAAKKLSAYLVINLSEKEWCNEVPQDTRPCANNGLSLYNTNVVFDRRGAVISRYRKVHLYGENKNTTFVPELGWFDTDFGIRFGHFICFDILFYNPAQTMVSNGIKDFIFPSMWFSQLPFLTALQFHQAWSYANDVNLLAAGSSNPLVGSTGSGVYHGRKGIVLAKINRGMGERKLYVAEVPKYRYVTKRSLTESSGSQNDQSSPNITLKQDFLQDYKTVTINLSPNTSLKQNICFSNSSFCCNFDLKWRPLNFESENKHYHYRLGVYDGLRNEEAAETNQLKNCAVFSCIGDNITDCGKILDTNTDVVFENITITATFPKTDRFLIMPNSLNANIMPLPVNHFKWQETDKKNNRQVRYELNTTTTNVMAFAIYGNYYDCSVDIVPEEDDNIKNNTAVLLAKSLLVIMGIFVYILIF